MKNDERWLSHNYYVNYMIMQSNMTMMMCVIITEQWRLHGNISRNGYGNAMVGRYGGCFEEGYVVGLWYWQKFWDTREASNGGKVRVHIIHGLNISHKELTYLLQKSTSNQKPSTTRMLLGG